MEGLSQEIVRLVEEYAGDVAAVHARRHYASSGVHWRPGMVVTAAHTVRRDQDIHVTLAGGRSVPATLAGHDAGTDIALLKVEGLGAPAHAKHAGDAAAAKAGELALILGRSPDSGPNASLGVISANSGAWRTWSGGRLERYIRLDATLFPNSSGGAVIDCRGEILGIATSGLSRIAGLAIPAASIDRVLDSLLDKGYLPRGYFGVGIQPVAIQEATRKELKIENRSGLMVMSVEPGGPAGEAGALPGDILVSAGGERLETAGDLQTFTDSGEIGKAVKVSAIRAGKPAELSVTVGERPER